MKLYVIINGTETRIDNVKKSMTVRELAKIALKQTEKCARPKKPVDEWNVYGEHQQMDFNKTIGEQINMLQNGNLAFMTIRAGIGA